MFVEKYGTSGFSSFTCPEGGNSLLFSQLCVHHHSHTSEGSGLGVSTQTVSQQLEKVKPPKMHELSKKKKTQQNFGNKNGHIGQVTVGSKKNPV